MRDVADHDIEDIDMDAQFCDVYQALCRAIEQHEAFRQEVSDAVEKAANAVYSDSALIVRSQMKRFIIAKPDPLVEAWKAEYPDDPGPETSCNVFRAAIEKRGGKIVWGENMTDIEQKALALVNEVLAENGDAPSLNLPTRVNSEAFCRAIEQHEAFRQEVSDAVLALLDMPRSDPDEEDLVAKRLARFIIAKPDPLVEVLADMGLKPKGGYDWASEFRNTLAQRGGKIVWGEE